MSAPAGWCQTARTIKIVVPYAPGSGPDILGRLLAEQIGRTNGQTIFVESRPGAGTVIGTEAVARAAPDGNTVLVVAPSFVINPTLRKVNYDAARDFEPICHLAATPLVLVTNSASPYRTVADLLNAARAKPGELTLGSGGPGSSLHIAIEVLKRAAGINMTYVPFAGSGPAINALLGGHLTAVFADYPTVVEQLKTGTLRALATTSRTRAEDEIWYGLVAPAKTPQDILSQLSGWAAAAINSPDMKPKLELQGLSPGAICGSEFGALLRKRFEDYARVIRESNIKAD
jgi:tripartite-type tricarboxylate transporter receptor subunit TctC